MTREFYATVQNKMHYAVHGNTAAEVIVARADHNKEHMGLKSVSYTHLDVYKRQVSSAYCKGIA